MSQKKESITTDMSNDKWRELAEQEQQEEPTVDDEHLLADGSVPIEETADNKLRDQLHLLEKQVEFYKDQGLRTQAEAENMRRRLEQEVTKARKFGVESLVSELIPIAESLIRGLEGEQNSNDQKVQLMRQGMQLTLDMLDKVLQKNGVLRIDPKCGDPFDPMQHEAMSMQSDVNAQSNTILQVLQKGYALHGRVIRAAMVIVAA